MSVRYYARRTKTGEWLDTDVPITVAPSWGLNGNATSSGVIAGPLVVETASDGQPMWLYRGTTLYREENGVLTWAGLCSYPQPGPTELRVEFVDLFGGFDLIEWRGALSMWNPDPFAVVEALLTEAQTYDGADLGFVVLRDGAAPRRIGDEEPPAKPAQPPRMRDETLEDYDDRLVDWEMELDAWDALYGSRRPYAVHLTDNRYVAEVIRELADTVPFQLTTRYRWVDRAALTVAHEVILSPVRSVRRTDVAVTEGINLREPLDPRPNVDTLGNVTIGIGPGEGPDALRAEIAVPDSRIRTTHFYDRKDLTRPDELQAFVATTHQQANIPTIVESATIDAASAVGINPGDEIEIRSEHFTGWLRVTGVTRPDGAPTTLSFI